MAKAYVFSGKGAQFVGMGKDLYESNKRAQLFFDKAIDAAPVSEPICSVYQNVDVKPHTDPVEIKENLLKQLTSPICWTQSVKIMIGDGMTEFVECGPGQVLTGMVGRIINSLE